MKNTDGKPGWDTSDFFLNGSELPEVFTYNELVDFMELCATSGLHSVGFSENSLGDLSLFFALW